MRAFTRLYIQTLLRVMKYYASSISLPILSIAYSIYSYHISVVWIWFDFHTSEMFALKIRFNPPFSTFENVCIKSGTWQLLFIRLMCLIIWFGTFRFEFSSEFSIFWILHLIASSHFLESCYNTKTKKYFSILIHWIVFKTKVCYTSSLFALRNINSLL